MINGNKKNSSFYPRFFISNFEAVDRDVNNDPLLVLAGGLDSCLQLQQSILFCGK